MRRLLLTAIVLSAGCGTVDITPTPNDAGAMMTPCTSTDRFAGYGAGFFATNCRTWHEHTDDFATQVDVAAAAPTIRAQIQAGRMPEGAVLPGPEKQRVLAWLACGAP